MDCEKKGKLISRVGEKSKALPWIYTLLKQPYDIEQCKRIDHKKEKGKSEIVKQDNNGNPII